jgi:uncharacterized protein YbaP (TraB family)
MLRAMSRRHLVPVLCLLSLAACKKDPPPASETPPTAKAPTSAEPAVAPPPKADAPAPSALTGQPFMYTATRGQDKITLYGTIHTGGAAFVPPSAWTTLAQAKVFVMEADVQGIDQGQLMKMIELPPGQSLKKMISPEAWKTLIANKPALFPESKLETVKPWFAAMMILQSWLSGAEAVDLELKKKAVEQGAKVEYLETWQEQIGMIEKALDAKALEAFLKDIDEGKKSLGELVAAYKAGDDKKLLELTAKDPTMTDEARALILDQRNQNWMPRLLQLARQGDAFVAVGAAHLLGDKGVLKLLEKEGFTIVRSN